MAARLTGLLSCAGNGYVNLLAKAYGKSGATLVTFGKTRPDSQFGAMIVATGEFFNSRQQLVSNAPNEYQELRRIVNSEDYTFRDVGSFLDKSSSVLVTFAVASAASYIYYSTFSHDLPEEHH